MAGSEHWHLGKVMRMHVCCGAIEQGDVHLPEEADWLTPYLNELKVIPGSDLREFSGRGKFGLRFVWVLTILIYTVTSF